MAGKALIAMSGGVDSSVAAWLMKKAGWDCVGATMRLYEGTDPVNVEDAGQVADKIGIPFHVFDFRDSFKEKVIDPFIKCYQCGLTPNPCIQCNRHLKFDGLYERAKDLGCDVIVTGHYARIIQDEKGPHLLKGADPAKDQSYVLYSLTRDQLSRTRFPLGDYSKEEIRAIAEREGFLNARKKDSQDICFIPDGNYSRFIEESTGTKAMPGDFVDRTGKVLGKHRGYYCYTIGQRRGLGISAEHRIFVTDIIPEENKVVLGSNEDLMATNLTAGDFNWIEDPKSLKSQADLWEGSDNPEPIKARIRYHHKEQEADFRILEDGKVHIQFLQPQRAITKGQSVVLYRGDQVLGGGIITG